MNQIAEAQRISQICTMFPDIPLGQAERLLRIHCVGGLAKLVEHHMHDTGYLLWILDKACEPDPNPFIVGANEDGAADAAIRAYRSARPFLPED